MGTSLQVRDLQSDSQLIKSKTLVACLDLLNVPLSYVQCLAAGITPPLVALLQVRTLRTCFSCFQSCVAIACSV